MHGTFSRGKYVGIFRFICTYVEQITHGTGLAERITEFYIIIFAWHRFKRKIYRNFPGSFGNGTGSIEKITEYSVIIYAWNRFHIKDFPIPIPLGIFSVV